MYHRQRLRLANKRTLRVGPVTVDPCQSVTLIDGSSIEWRPVSIQPRLDTIDGDVIAVNERSTFPESRNARFKRGWSRFRSNWHQGTPSIAISTSVCHPVSNHGHWIITRYFGSTVRNQGYGSCRGWFTSFCSVLRLLEEKGTGFDWN